MTQVIDLHQKFSDRALNALLKCEEPDCRNLSPKDISSYNRLKNTYRKK